MWTQQPSTGRWAASHSVFHWLVQACRVCRLTCASLVQKLTGGMLISTVYDGSQGDHALHYTKFGPDGYLVSLSSVPLLQLLAICNVSLCGDLDLRERRLSPTCPAVRQPGSAQQHRAMSSVLCGGSQHHRVLHHPHAPKRLGRQHVCIRLAQQRWCATLLACCAILMSSHAISC